ncbi:hypothetical protein LC040_15915 [Bacillus tianshenii]|nr:hypothetical protein LC040_15915 [Bacillus tianshenii]
MKKTFSIAVLAGLIGFTGACTPANPEKTEILQGEDLEGQMKINQTNPSYRPEEGEELYEDQNPNFLNIGERKTQNTTGASQDMLRGVVVTDGKFNPGMIFTNGRKAYVYVRPKENYSKEELRKYRKELEKKLTMAVQRYEVVLRVRNAK